MAVCAAFNVFEFPKINNLSILDTYILYSLVLTAYFFQIHVSEIK